MQSTMLTIDQHSFDAGLYNMCVGEVRRLEIASEFAYGVKGTPDGAIPPNATLSKFFHLSSPNSTCSP